MGESKAEKAKYEIYDIKTFRPEPPEDTELIESLFCAREKELRIGVGVLESSIDIRGRVRGNKHPWVIHGESRSGKSHLARRIMLEFPDSGKRRRMLIAARERLCANAVMERVFKEIIDIFQERVSSIVFLGDLHVNQLITWTTKLIDTVLHFTCSTESVEITYNQLTTGQIQTGLKLSVVPKVLEFFAHCQNTRGEGESIQLNLRRPSASDFVDYIEMIVGALSALSLLDHVLILVDDIDLIEAYESADRNGRAEGSLLGDALVSLSQIPCVDVLLTARSWYARSMKDFQELLDLEYKFPKLSQDELVQIHNRRFDVYTRDASQETFLTRETLRRLAEGSDRLPGQFLEYLNEALLTYICEPHWGTRDYEWVMNSFRNKLEHVCRKFPAAARQLEFSIRANERSIDVGEKNVFYGLPLEHLFMIPAYSKGS